MKKSMKNSKAKNFLLFSALLGLLIPGISRAATSSPDLQVGIKVTDVRKNSNGSFNYKIRASVKNVGTAHYVSNRNQQTLNLYQGNSNLVKSWGFSRVNRGKTLNFSKAYSNQPGGEFVPSYKAKLVFDPDIYNDNNRANDDRNRNNNKAALSSNTLSSAFNRASSNARSKQTIQKYNLQPQNKSIQQIQPRYKIPPATKGIGK